MALSKEEELELEQLKREQASAIQTSGLSPEEEAELAQLKNERDQSSQMLSKPAPAVNPNARHKEAALSGFGQAATLGYLPQLQAMTRKPLELIYETVTGEAVPDRSYTEARDRYIKKDQALQEEAPKSYLGGQVGGTVLSSLAPGAAIGKFGKGLKAVKDISTAGKIGRAALTGAATNALYNPGDVEGEINLLQLEDRGKNALKGAVTGAATQGLLSAGGGLLKAYANKAKPLKEMSDSLALDSIGARKAHVKSLLKRDKIDDLTDFIKKENIAQAGGTFDDAAKRAASIVDESGRAIGETYKNVQNQLNNPQFLKSLNEKQAKELLDTEIIPDKLIKELIKDAKDKFGSDPGGPEAIKYLEKQLSPMKNLGKVPELDKILNFRRKIDNKINFSNPIRDLPENQQALTFARNFIKDKIDKRISVVDKIIGGETGAILKNLNKRFSLGSEALQVVEDKLASEQANRTFGLTDTMLGTAGAALGAGSALAQGDVDPETLLKRGLIGGSIALGSRGLRRYGPATGSQVLGSAAKMLEKDPTGKAAGLLGDASGLLRPELIGIGSNTIGKKSKLQEKKKEK